MATKIEVAGRSPISSIPPSEEHIIDVVEIIDEEAPLLSSSNGKQVHDKHYTEITLPKSIIYERRRVLSNTSEKQKKKQKSKFASVIASNPNHVFTKSPRPEMHREYSASSYFLGIQNSSPEKQEATPLEDVPDLKLNE
jgi:hypothetical protein